MLNVSEIFGPTVQGEGLRVGRPSIFIRLAGCNFRCQGLAVEYIHTTGEKKYGCDTYYAVDPCFKNEWQSLSAQELINQITRLCNNHRYDLVITGGEPLLFWKQTEFQHVIKHFSELNHQITIETNASLAIEFSEEYQKKILFSMSVKLAYVNEAKQKRINIPALQNIIQHSHASYFKFVINSHHAKQCLQEIQAITSQLPPIDVYLMPQGDTIDALAQHDQSVIQLCTEHNYIYCDRTHIRIWNDRRGV